MNNKQAQKNSLLQQIPQQLTWQRHWTLRISLEHWPSIIPRMYCERRHRPGYPTWDHSPPLKDQVHISKRQPNINFCSELWIHFFLFCIWGKGNSSVCTMLTLKYSELHAYVHNRLISSCWDQFTWLPCACVLYICNWTQKITVCSVYLSVCFVSPFSHISVFQFSLHSCLSHVCLFSYSPHPTHE